MLIDKFRHDDAFLKAFFHWCLNLTGMLILEDAYPDAQSLSDI